MQVAVTKIKIRPCMSQGEHSGSEILIMFTCDGGLTFNHSCSRVNYAIPSSKGSEEAQKQAFIIRAKKWL